MLLTPLSQSSSSSQKSGPRPIKLRSACNQCCAAKVRLTIKCSGQRTGCDRCQNLGTPCIYMESRVGKVPGIRGKRRKTQSGENQHVGQNTGAVSDLVTTGRGHEKDSFEDEGDDQTISWATEPQVNASDEDGDFIDHSNTHSSHSSSHVVDTSTSNFQSSSNTLIGSSTSDFSVLPTMGFNLDELLMSTTPLNSPHQTQSASLNQTSDSLGIFKNSVTQDQQQKNAIDSECVVECCQMISDLESYIVADLRAFKIILGIVREGFAKLQELIGFQQTSRNLRCMMLFATIMYQIHHLLESCHARLASEGEDGLPTSAASRSLGLRKSGLGLGKFCIDAEEQSTWRSEIILKEVHQGVEVLRMIKALAGVGPDGFNPETPQEKAREHCYVDIELCWKDLAERIAQSRLCDSTGRQSY
ncbi:hypothetical protein GQ43DRAFT_460840 [Delitschia confertaspora ATCC 74209]|uniref:Zn(2)-C6 fungal-type domain-containing protein n=1 Tax=Delitschia confertaspora ATCC 74209 TaxID=1513339 RepID=A0A9P4JSD4_9PLEO|nr:hypothetical protein GQ43DRAFT_460840 [Delitschia confertaspora ATCC 74209]